VNYSVANRRYETDYSSKNFTSSGYPPLLDQAAAKFKDSTEFAGYSDHLLKVKLNFTINNEDRDKAVKTQTKRAYAIPDTVGEYQRKIQGLKEEIQRNQ